MFSWLGSLAWVLLTTTVIGGVAVASGAKEFFSKSSDLEQKLTEKLEVSNSSLSSSLSSDLEEVITKGKDLMDKLMEKTKESLDTIANP